MPISDATLARISREAKVLKTRAKKLKARAARRDKAIIREMERRGTKSLTHAGVKITVVTGSHIEYDMDRLRESLPGAKLRLITKTVVDKDRLSAAVASRKISLAKVDECSDQMYHEPYVVVSGVRE